MIIIKKIEYDDLEELECLYEELLEKKTNQKKFRENFEWINSNSDYILIGAKTNGILVGSLMGIICKDLGGECKPFMVIENVIVKSNNRGMGIGKKLMSYIEEFARERNCNFSMLVSAFKRKEAHKFYESIGYENDLVKGYKKYFLKGKD